MRRDRRKDAGAFKPGCRRLDRDARTKTTVAGAAHPKRLSGPQRHQRRRLTRQATNAINSSVLWFYESLADRRREWVAGGFLNKNEWLSYLRIPLAALYPALVSDLECNNRLKVMSRYSRAWNNGLRRRGDASGFQTFACHND